MPMLGEVEMNTEWGAVLGNESGEPISFAGHTKSAVHAFSGLIARFVVGLAAAFPSGF